MDNELKAMTVVSEALEGLADEERVRVLSWARSKFAGEPTPPVDPGANGGPQTGKRSYTDVGELVDATRAAAGPERALAVAYWIQVIDGRESWPSSDVNAVLKNLGHGLTNVTKTMSGLMTKKPALVIQTSKAGKSQQARKTYKLTAAGIKAVETMLTLEDDD